LRTVDKNHTLWRQRLEKRKKVFRAAIEWALYRLSKKAQKTVKFLALAPNTPL